MITYRDANDDKRLTTYINMQYGTQEQRDAEQFLGNMINSNTNGTIGKNVEDRRKLARYLNLEA